MKFLNILLLCLFFSSNITAEENELTNEENEDTIIEESRFFKIYLKNTMIEYDYIDEDDFPEWIPDHDGDGIRDEEDPDHPSNDEDNYSSWRVFLNTFCGQNFSNDEEMNENVNGSSIYCEGFAKMPTEELLSTELNEFSLSGDNRFNKISGLSNVLEIKDFDISAASASNSAMSQLIDLSNLSGKIFDTLSLNGITSSNLSGITIKTYLTLFGSYINNINSNMISGCCTQLRASRVDNYTINSSGKLSGLYVIHGSHLGNLNMTGSKEIELVSFESAWNNGDWGFNSTLNNTNALSDLIMDYISIMGNTEIEMDLTGLSASLNRNRIERLRVTSKDFDFSALNNVNSIGQFEVYATKIDFKDMENISVIESGSIDTYSESDWDIIPEDEYENFTKNLNILGKASVSSNFCQGLQNGNINLSFKYNDKNLNIPYADICE